jgi:hypothetical protein
MRSIRLTVVACCIALGATAAGISEDKAALIELSSPVGVVAESCPMYRWTEVPGATEYEVSFDFPRQGFGCSPTHFIWGPFRGAKTFKSASACSNNPTIEGTTFCCQNGRCQLGGHVAPGYNHMPKQCDGTAIVSKWSVIAKKGGAGIASSTTASWSWNGSQPCHNP